VLVLLIDASSPLILRLTVSIFFASSITFGFASKWLICSSSELDLIIIALFFVIVPSGLTSIPMEGGLFLKAGNFNRDTPCMLVALFSQLTVF
jgi:hypothetical protein